MTRTVIHGRGGEAERPREMAETLFCHRPGARRRDIHAEALETDRERFDRLTHREQEVVRLVGLGYSAPEIGRQLSISPKTVDTYKQRIQEKAHLWHRSQYVRFAYDLGLFENASATSMACPAAGIERKLGILRET